VIIRGIGMDLNARSAMSNPSCGEERLRNQSMRRQQAMLVYF